MIDLTGKPIAITGASSGIGRATAIACAKAGMPVALAARRIEKLESAVREIVSAGGRAFVTPALLEGRWMVRFSLGAEMTERDDVVELWRLAREAVARC